MAEPGSTLPAPPAPIVAEQLQELAEQPRKIDLSRAPSLMEQRAAGWAEAARLRAAGMQ